MDNQTTLLNFSKASLVKTLNPKLVLSKNNVLHTQPICCPKCNNLCVYNGFSHEGNYNPLAKENFIFFKKGQQYCSTCDKTYQVEFPEFEELNQLIVDRVKNNIKSLLEFGNSENDIKLHIKRTENITVSIPYIKLVRKEFFKEVETSFPELDKLEDKNLQGFNGYDEQYIKVDGKKYLRIVVFNLDTNEVIYQELVKKLTSEKLEQILKDLFKENKPRGFVFDMRTMYVKVFKKVFGKDIKLQYCIFHLNKSIMDKFKEANRFVSEDLWTLEEIYKMYSIFNIFYDRNIELDYIIRLQNKLAFASSFLTIRTLKGLEKSLIKEFRKQCHDFKLERIREKRTLKQRTKEDAKSKLEEVLQLCKIPKYFPKKVVRQLRKVAKNFSCFTGGIEEGILTNNRLEGFFGSTLKKFQKKTFNVLEHFSAFLKLKKLRKKGLSLLKEIPLNKHLFAQMLIFAFQQ